ncbi:cytochrome monooxygenase aflU [Penicillium diatomitis]|uniref:Cytochrome monooxygenase aflU n=1 Tax=Penicillium diatomitis TaxID=2819901 RepID=A0A9X0C2D4_9EURO|nr:cytochrome monooxygenase aflU [Penicillium diatomitis]KAJ5495040.1 cytochrome monooxygenase aflU [Penicillium diatomitis]
MAGLAVWVVGGLLAYRMALVVYRVFFHPLRKIPGPKLAAMSTAYQFYYEIIKQGTFIWHLEKLHEIYGPIVRIGPREVHIKDSEYYETIYASSGRRREKDAAIVAQFDIPGSSFSSVSPEIHRMRRSPVEKFFSKGAINRTEQNVQKHLDKLVARLEQAQKAHKVVAMDAGFAAMTSDIIHEYVFGLHTGNLDQEDFNERIRDGVNGLFKLGHLSRFLPWIQPLMATLPRFLMDMLSPYAFALMDQKQFIHDQVVAIQTGQNKGSAGSVMEKLSGPGLPDHFKSARNLSDEGFALVIGGTETTARSLSVGLFHLLNEPRLIHKLREELRAVMPTPTSKPTWNQLEQVPYMMGVVLETFRLATGIASRSPRVAPSEALVYKDYTIPPGHMVSQVNYFVLMDPTIFPDPEVFDPERWTRAAAKGERLDKFLVNFSKGSRICLGMNLAYAEIYLTIATLVRRFELELFETTKENIAFARDFGTPYPDQGNYSLRVLVKGQVSE